MPNNLFSCKGKIAVVTGGSGLIGREIVKGLINFGAKVCIADINEKRSLAAARRLKAGYIYLDITSEGSVRSGFSKICKEYRRIDVVVNCAYPRTKDWGCKFEQISLVSWNKNINDHLGGYFLASQAAAEIMRKNRTGGSIINIASIYGVVAPDFSIYKRTKMTMPAAYSAIKGGIVSFTKYLAAYYAGDNIRANVVSPGGVFDNQSASFVRNYSAKTLLGRMAKPQDIVGAVVYLASDAANYVTGINLLVDGGWTAL